jgi:hypothetical protein
LSSFGQLDADLESEYVQLMANKVPEVYDGNNTLLNIPILSENMKTIAGMYFNDIFFMQTRAHFAHLHGR